MALVSLDGKISTGILSILQNSSVSVVYVETGEHVMLSIKAILERPRTSSVCPIFEPNL